MVCSHRGLWISPGPHFNSNLNTWNMCRSIHIHSYRSWNGPIHTNMHIHIVCKHKLDPLEIGPMMMMNSAIWIFIAIVPLWSGYFPSEQAHSIYPSCCHTKEFMKYPITNIVFASRATYRPYMLFYVPYACSTFSYSIYIYQIGICQT